MTRGTRMAVALTGAVLLSSGAFARAQTPAAAGGTKLISPVRGQAEIGYLTPVSKREGTMVVTTIKIKNMAAAPDRRAEGGRVLVRQGR